MRDEWIPFNWPYMTGKELYHIAEAHFNGKLAGDGPFTKRCHSWLEKDVGARKALLTHSCTAALEMSALLLDLHFGDEVIMPSYTFVSTANAFVLRGATPVFVDVRPDTLNIDESLIEAAITSKTKAIVVVHYAGVGCEMDEILAIAKKYSLKVIEDAAQGVMASYRGRALGTIGDMGAYSFHETKNIISGEGGALLVNQEEYVVRSEIIREKGTDRGKFFRGEVDKYTWQDYGSSFLPGELTAAFLWAQIEEARFITDKRLEIWGKYHEAFAMAEERGLIQRPHIPSACSHNAHMYYLLLPSEIERNRLIDQLGKKGVHAIFHYIPLHNSPAGLKFGRFEGTLAVTESISSRIVRLPLWCGLSNMQVDRVISSVLNLIK